MPASPPGTNASTPHTEQLFRCCAIHMKRLAVSQIIVRHGGDTR